MYGIWRANYARAFLISNYLHIDILGYYITRMAPDSILMKNRHQKNPVYKIYYVIKI
jgi:hypothetical protein